jgi:hypothetical protein
MNTLHSSILENEDKKVFDELAEHVLSVSDRIFPPAPPVDSSQTTFTVSEMVVASKAGSGSFHEEIVVCPKARLYETTVERPKVFKCRCCCAREPHSDDLTYKRK